jgi:ferredoxin
MRIKIERDICISNGRCLRVAPGVFERDDDGIASVRDRPVGDLEAVRSAELGCPSGAIELLDGHPGEPLRPA